MPQSPFPKRPTNVGRAGEHLGCHVATPFRAKTEPSTEARLKGLLLHCYGCVAVGSFHLLYIDEASQPLPTKPGMFSLSTGFLSVFYRLFKCLFRSGAGGGDSASAFCLADCKGSAR